MNPILESHVLIPTVILLIVLEIFAIAMERDTAIIFFIFGFIMVFWLIISVTWLLYLTLKLYTVRNELMRKIANVFSELICQPTDDLCQHLQLTTMPPPYRELEHRD